MKVRAKSIVHDRLYSESENPNLTSGQEYHVVGISVDFLRVINDIGEPILYETELFDVVDPEIPADWIRKDFADNEGKYFYCDPPGLEKPGFYEDYFDGIEYAVAMFEAYCKQYTLPTRKKNGRTE